MDLDKQANTTKFFQCFDPRGKTMASVLTLDNKLGDVICHREKFKVDVAPSCMSMNFANKLVMLEAGRPQHNRIANALAPLADAYDYCIMDCRLTSTLPPSTHWSAPTGSSSRWTAANGPWTA